LKLEFKFQILKIGSGPGESVYPDPTRELATS